MDGKRNRKRNLHRRRRFRSSSVHPIAASRVIRETYIAGDGVIDVPENLVLIARRIKSHPQRNNRQIRNHAKRAIKQTLVVTRNGCDRFIVSTFHAGLMNYLALTPLILLVLTTTTANATVMLCIVVVKRILTSSRWPPAISRTNFWRSRGSARLHRQQRLELGRAIVSNLVDDSTYSYSLICITLLACDRYQFIRKPLNYSNQVNSCSHRQCLGAGCRHLYRADDAVQLNAKTR